MTTKTALRTSVAVLALMAGGRAASAQTAAQAPQAAAGSEGSIVGEVLVTATKRDTKLQETPIAITAIGAKALVDQHINTIEDVTHLVPSFQATSEGDHGVITLTLRGVGNDSAKTEYADPEVAIFVDGVYSPRADGATALLFDLDTLEVDRGPQGTLFGRNSTVGAVNMITAKPKIDSLRRRPGGRRRRLRPVRRARRRQPSDQRHPGLPRRLRPRAARRLCQLPGPGPAVAGQPAGGGPGGRRCAARPTSRRSTATCSSRVARNTTPRTSPRSASAPCGSRSAT